MRIAICDDEVRGRERIRTLLEKEFSQAQRSEFDSGMKLLEAVEKGYQPDIVLLDIAMEGMNGMETAKRLRETVGCHSHFCNRGKGTGFSGIRCGGFSLSDEACG